MDKKEIQDAVDEYFYQCRICPDNDEVIGFIADVFGAEGVKVYLS